MKRILSFVCVFAMMLCAMSAMPLTSSAAAKGDYNGDGRIDTLDVRMIMRAALGADAITQKLIFVGDMSPDNKLTTADAQVLMRQVLRSDTPVAQAPEYAHPADTDLWGERSIALIGDSISFGAGAADPLPEYTYASFVKKAVQAANHGHMNYGFTSCYPSNWNAAAASEIHSWPDRTTTSDGKTAWVCDDNDDGNRLYSIGFTSVTAWSMITYKLREQYVNNYSYFCVYYQAEPDAGTFCIANDSGGEVKDVNGSSDYVRTNNSTSITKRTAFYPLKDCPKDSSGRPKIIICHDGTTKPVTITGIGYYKDISPSTTTFNAYTRGGSSLTKMSDQVLSQAATSDTLIMAMGYNDVYWNSNLVNSGVFAQKIDHLIAQCKANDTKVIISDHVWDNTSVIGRNSAQEKAYQTVKSEYKRFARETNGIYIDQQGIHGQAMLDSLNGVYEHTGAAADGVHPNSAGHRLIASSIVMAMDLTWTESWT